MMKYLLAIFLLLAPVHTFAQCSFSPAQEAQLRAEGFRRSIDNRGIVVWIRTLSGNHGVQAGIGRGGWTNADPPKTTYAPPRPQQNCVNGACEVPQNTGELTDKGILNPYLPAEGDCTESLLVIKEDLRVIRESLLDTATKTQENMVAMSLNQQTLSDDHLAIMESLQNLNDAQNQMASNQTEIVQVMTAMNIQGAEINYDKIGTIVDEKVRLLTDELKEFIMEETIRSQEQVSIDPKGDSEGPLWLYITRLNSEECRETDAEVQQRIEEGYNIRMVVLMPEEIEDVKNIPRIVKFPEREYYRGAGNVKAYLVGLVK